MGKLLNNKRPIAGNGWVRYWGRFQLLLLLAGITLVLVASVHMIEVAVTSQPECAGLPQDSSQAGSYMPAKRSCRN